MKTRASWTLSVLTIALGAYLAFLLTRYFYPPHVPRFRVESLFMWFVAAGVAAICLRPSSGRGQDAEAGTPEGGPRAGPPRAAWHYAAIAAFFGAIALLEYGSALQVGLLSDDFVLADWARKREWVHLAETGFLRPVVPFFWTALSFVSGRLDLTLHAANVLLHALNAVLIVALGGRLGMGRLESLVAGLLFVTAPALSEAVVWCSGMQDVLTTTLGLSAILAATSVGGVSEGSLSDVRVASDAARIGVRVLLAVGSAVLALGVKETAVVIPVLAVAVAWAVPSGLKRGIRPWTLAAMMLVATLYALYRVVFLVPSPYRHGVVSRYFAKQLIVGPFATLAEPWSTAWMEAHPFTSLIRALAIVGLLTAAFVTWRRGEGVFRRAAAFAAWVLLGVLPVFSLFHVSSTLEGSRYLYLPAVGFAMLLASLMGALARTAGTILRHTGLRHAGLQHAGLQHAGSRHAGPALVGVLFVVFAAPSVKALGAEIGRWNDAARLRDAILDQVAGNDGLARCRSFSTVALADNVEGAYVFRNGLDLALAARRGGAPTVGTPTDRCQISWMAERVVLVTALP